MKAATEGLIFVSRDIDISIHAAREGGDCVIEFFLLRIEISIHAAREGGDNNIFCRFIILFGFQSTPPVKAATERVRECPLPMWVFQSTPPVKAATQSNYSKAEFDSISIHAAREGGDFILAVA